jgi:UrcA family protein
MPHPISSGRPARRWFAAAALAMSALTPFAAALAAAPAVDTPLQVIVKFADLDLATDVGARVLLRRIEAAAEQICGDPRGLLPLDRQARVQQCNTQAIAHAVADVGAPRVTLVYRARYPANSVG